ncbi:hypothetical protein CTY75_24705, partial [Acinetobacter baumannii]|nr:hypothetical protein [Acinetobacter baumannii]
WHTTFFVMAALTLIAILSIVFGLRNLQLKKTVELEGESKRTNFKGHIANTKVLVSNSAFWLVCLFNIALMTYLWGLNSWVPSLAHHFFCDGCAHTHCNFKHCFWSA